MSTNKEEIVAENTLADTSKWRLRSSDDNPIVEDTTSGKPDIFHKITAAALTHQIKTTDISTALYCVSLYCFKSTYYHI